ncbi:MAG: P-type conjugative transfer protein TrbL [Deltaproteobacteria bacterium]|jgi:type IV secretion system protein TrbL|nr:P-type conjugative transfer protein TrbL [Deltaproteobacteria bacterium]
MNIKIKNRFNIITFLVIVSVIILSYLLLSSQISSAAPQFYNAGDERVTAEAVTAHNTSIITDVVNEFFTRSQAWAGKLENSVQSLFVIFFTLEIVMLGLTAVIKREALEDIMGGLVMAAVSGGLILVCIVNYAEWSKAIMIGLTDFTGALGPEYNSKEIVMNPLDKGFEVFSAIMDKISLWSPVNSLGFFLGGLAILICFALITIQIVYVKCEAFVAVGASFILLGFGGCSFFREYATNLLRYVISVGFKLYVLYVVLGLGFSFIQDLIIIPVELTYRDLGALLVIALILLALTKALPDVVAGIIQGAHVSTGHHMTQTITQVGGLAAGAGIAAAAAGANTPGMIKNVASAAQAARDGGASGVLGTVGGTVKNLRDARKLAMEDTGRISMNRRMGSKLDQMKEAQKQN